ncbi:DNA-binding response regulator [Cohnella yongneupensis]|uniref:DNA-binding response regulator n=1 Tax=Cohnella yongneupensis TaxID=425006 RepID=A0ABW0QVX1_9BACL
MDFHTAYEAFINKHRKLRTGRRLTRLIEGHGYLEKLVLQNIWWPAIGNFDHLHPEYEVSDFRDGTRFLDFAWLPGPIKLNVEGDGHETHGNKISKENFSDERLRQNHLVIDDWKVLRFSHDSVKDQPRMCQQLLQQFMGKFFGSLRNPAVMVSLEEREILRLAFRLGGVVCPVEVCILLRIEQQTARKRLHGLLEKGLLEPVSPSNRRVARYRVTKSITDEHLR